MKSPTLLLALSLLTTPVLAQDLPFVGERLFSMGDGARETLIHIAKNGKTTIKESHRDSITTVYQGNYQSYLPIKENGKITGYYQIKGDKVHWLNRQKQQQTGCFAYKSALDDEREWACVAELETLKTVE